MPSTPALPGHSQGPGAFPRRSARSLLPRRHERRRRPGSLPLRSAAAARSTARTPRPPSRPAGSAATPAPTRGGGAGARVARRGVRAERPRRGAARGAGTRRASPTSRGPGGNFGIWGERARPDPASRTWQGGFHRPAPTTVDRSRVSAPVPCAELGGVAAGGKRPAGPGAACRPAGPRREAPPLAELSVRPVLSAGPAGPPSGCSLLPSSRHELPGLEEREALVLTCSPTAVRLSPTGEVCWSWVGHFHDSVQKHPQY